MSQVPGILRGCLPAMTATSGWFASRLVVHDAGLALGMAGLVGFLTLLASTEAQCTIRTWIRHRAETRIAAAEAYRIRHQVRAATSGPRLTTTAAAQVREAAAALNPDRPSLAEIMRITRDSSPTDRVSPAESPVTSSVAMARASSARASDPGVSRLH